MENKKINKKREKEVINILLNRYIQKINENAEILEFGEIPETCKKENISTLLNEAKNNFEDYPNDKICRWLGFSNGIMSFDSPVVSVSINTTSDVKRILKKTINKNKEYEERSDINEIFYSFNMLLAMLNYAKMEFNNGSVKTLEIHYIIGYVQGVMALFRAIDVEEEREYTRPLLHSFHEEKIKTFSI